MPFEQATKLCQALQTGEDVGPTQTGGGGKPSQIPVGLEHTELRQNGTLVPDSGGSLCTGDCDIASDPMAPLLLQLQSWFGQGWLWYPGQSTLPEGAEARIPTSTKIRCDKVVGHILLIHYLRDLKHDINQSSPERPLTYSGTEAVPCVGQDIGSSVIVPSISQGCLQKGGFGQ